MDHVDFLPERIRVQRARRRRLIRQAHLLAVCVGALAVLGYVRHERLGRARAELELLGGRAANLENQLDVRRRLESEQADLLIMKRIEEQLGSRVDTLDVLAEIERVLPRGISLRSLALETKAVPVKVRSARRVRDSSRARRAERDNVREEATVQRLRLELKGLSPTNVDIANFIGQLSASPLFEDVHMGYAKDVVLRGRTAREFQASCHVVR